MAGADGQPASPASQGFVDSLGKVFASWLCCFRARLSTLSEFRLLRKTARGRCMVFHGTFIKSYATTCLHSRSYRIAKWRSTAWFQWWSTCVPAEKYLKSRVWNGRHPQGTLQDRQDLAESTLFGYHQLLSVAIRRGSKYPIFKLSAPKYHEEYGFWNQKPQLLGTSNRPAVLFHIVECDMNSHVYLQLLPTHDVVEYLALHARRHMRHTVAAEMVDTIGSPRAGGATLMLCHFRLSFCDCI